MTASCCALDEKHGKYTSPLSWMEKFVFEFPLLFSIYSFGIVMLNSAIFFLLAPFNFPLNVMHTEQGERIENVMVLMIPTTVGSVHNGRIDET